MFEIWDLTTRNAAGFFETKAEALRAVREAAQEYGPAYVEDLILVREDAQGRSRTLARGARLLELAGKETSGQAAR